MKIEKLFMGLMILSSVSYSTQSLIEKAKDNNLLAIPENKTELYKIIDPKGLLTPEKVLLGKKLFFEPRLSKASDISCASCHDLQTGGDDNIPVAIGHKGGRNPFHLNSPTVFNAVFFDRQFWDGRSPDLEDQAKGPIQAGVEMAATPALVEKRVNAIAEYVSEFKKVYGKDVKIDFNLITSTIGAFERTLVTPSKFDDFLNGKKDALSKAEKDGLNTFINKGCTSCHKGIGIGGSMQPFDVAAEFKFSDVGGFKGGKGGLIKVGTLRNITQTSPYFHNGTFKKLKNVIKEMARIQLGIKITQEEIDSIYLFLKTLDGRKSNIDKPTLPKDKSKK